MNGEMDGVDGTAGEERPTTLYQALVEGSPYGMFALAPNGHIVAANASLGTLLGVRPGHMLGRRLVDFVAQEDRGRARRDVEAQFRSGAGEHHGEYRVRHDSQGTKVLRVTLIPTRTGPRVTGLHGIALDVTEDRSRQRLYLILAAAVEHLDEAVSVFDGSGRFLFVNAAHGRVFGAAPGDAPQQEVRSHLPDAESWYEFEAGLDMVRKEGWWHGRVTRLRLSDGAQVIVEGTWGIVRDRGEECFFAVERDVTERVQQKEKLRRAERLASLGALVAGVAHELSNPLTAIQNFAEVLLMEPRSEDDREAMEAMRREAERARRIVSRLTGAARVGVAESSAREPLVCLNDVVLHILRTRRRSLAAAKVELRTDLGSDLPGAAGVASDLEQVVLNLVANAEHALLQVSGLRVLVVRTRATDQGISFAVVDNGPGIPTEYLHRIFDPFWTTKPPGEGTGLGLSLVRAIVTEHGGDIRVESEPGKGTAFTVTLPAASPARAARRVGGALSWPGN